jgi:hypothetical protein
MTVDDADEPVPATAPVQGLLRTKTIVHRLSRMTKAQAMLIEPGDMYRLGMYVATSTKKAALAAGHSSGLREWQEGETGTAVR